MKVQYVSIGPTQAALDAGAPTLTPELCASVGARYSRNNEGLVRIMAQVRGMDPDKAVDSIFRMVDYGHASIADMAPIVMFIDEVSCWSIFQIFNWCQRASGQESSTRYIDFSVVPPLAPGMAGIPEAETAEWQALLKEAMEHYGAMTRFWADVAERRPEAMRLPAELLADAAANPDGSSAKKVERMRRNFVFDRARYWLPAAALNNVMLVMPVRDWADLVKMLASHPSPELQAIGAEIRKGLELGAPRMVRHAKATQDWIEGHRIDAEDGVTRARFMLEEYPDMLRDLADHEVKVAVHGTAGAFRADITKALSQHPHRYSWIGRNVRRIPVSVSIEGVSLAELRDLNRHRTGERFTDGVPVGFYAAEDQVEGLEGIDLTAFNAAWEFGLRNARRQLGLVADGRADAPYWGLFGTQYDWEHHLQLDKLIYMIELRTGLGAHYRYAKHFRDVHDALVKGLPVLEGLIQLGQAEPE